MGEKEITKKEGIYEKEGVLYVIGPKYIAKVAGALASETRTRILEYLLKGPIDLDVIADKIGQSKANISSQIRKLENVDIVRARYMPGQRGIKKVVELNVTKIVFMVSPEE
jgi:predicted transcriptional regulator